MAAVATESFLRLTGLRSLVRCEQALGLAVEYVLVPETEQICRKRKST